MSVKATSDLWWKDAIVYCLDIETFFDTDHDGVVTDALTGEKIGSGTKVEVDLKASGTRLLRITHD